MINTVIFDMDGTLLDTIEDLADATNAGLKACGYPDRSLDEIKSYVGNGVGVLIEKALPEGAPKEDMEKCLSVFKEYYALHWKDKTAPYEGILLLLDQLKQRGIKTAVISNKYDQAVTELARDYFPGKFDVTWGERPGVPRKPAPDAIYAILDKLGAQKEQAVYVGDSEVDMATARNAGLASVGVTWGFRDRQLLEKEGAVYIIDQPQELLEIIG